MNLIHKQCKHCGNPFNVSKSYADFQIKNGKSEPKFCSRRCFGLSITVNDAVLVDAVINRYQSGESSRELGLSFDLSDATIRNILKRNSIPRRTQSELMLGKKNPTKGIGHSEKTKALISQQKAELYKNGNATKDKIRQNTLSQIANGKMPKANTSIEKAMSQILIEMQIRFVYQHPFGYWVFDFYLPDANLFIECDGDYWHGNSASFSVLNATQKNNIGRGKQKEAYAKSHGYKLLRFWGSEINGDISLIKSSIEAAL